MLHAFSAKFCTSKLVHCKYIYIRRLYDETDGSTGLWDGSTGFRNLYKPIYIYKLPCTKHKGVYGFQGDLNPVGPEGFIV